MAFEYSLIQGTLVNQFCGADYATGHVFSYGLLIIAFVGIYYAMIKKNYTLYTIMPVACFGVSFVALGLYTLNCMLEPAITGKFMVSLFFLTALFTALRVARHE